MRVYRVPNFVEYLYPRRLWRVPANSRKLLYLTFDDGPTDDITPWILETLGQYNAKATFFCLGQNVESYPDSWHGILKAQHKVGNHTHAHLNGWKSKDNSYLDDIAKCAKLLESKLFRPPYGRITSSQVEALLLQGFRIVMWTLLTHDYDPMLNKEKAWNYISKNVRAGDIIVFHDSQKAKENLQYLLPRTLEHFSKEGYTFAAL